MFCAVILQEIKIEQLVILYSGTWYWKNLRIFCSIVLWCGGVMSLCMMHWHGYTAHRCL